MFLLFGHPFYWPGERALHTQVDLAREEASNLREEVAEERRGRAADVARLTDAVLKAKGIYAGPLQSYAAADGTGYSLDDQQVVGSIVTYDRRSDRMGMRGMTRVIAEVELGRHDRNAMVEARHVEWEGIKWKATSSRSEVDRDVTLGGAFPTFTKTTVTLEAFVEYVQPGKV